MKCIGWKIFMNLNSMEILWWRLFLILLLIFMNLEFLRLNWLVLYYLFLYFEFFNINFIEKVVINDFIWIVKVYVIELMFVRLFVYM